MYLSIHKIKNDRKIPRLMKRAGNASQLSDFTQNIFVYPRCRDTEGVQQVVQDVQYCVQVFAGSGLVKLAVAVGRENFWRRGSRIQRRRRRRRVLVIHLIADGVESGQLGV